MLKQQVFADTLEFLESPALICCYKVFILKWYKVFLLKWSKDADTPQPHPRGRSPAWNLTSWCYWYKKERKFQLIEHVFLTGNIASIFLLTRKELSSFFNQLLAILCTFDMIYLLTMMLEAIRNLGLETSAHVVLFSYLLYPLNAIAMMGSIYMTIVIGFERSD